MNHHFFRGFPWFPPNIFSTLFFRQSKNPAIHQVIAIIQRNVRFYTIRCTRDSLTHTLNQGGFPQVKPTWVCGFMNPPNYSHNHHQRQNSPNVSCLPSQSYHKSTYINYKYLWIHVYTHIITHIYIYTQRFVPTYTPKMAHQKSTISTRNPYTSEKKCSLDHQFSMVKSPDFWRSNPDVQL